MCSGPMTDQQQALELLQDLDARQDEVLLELDKLNQRVESLLKLWTRSNQNADSETDASA